MHGHRAEPRRGSEPRYASGGTLRVGVPTTFSPFTTGKHILDPQKSYSYEPWELFRCCLLRTLLGFEGAPTNREGTILRPDLASGLPEISPNGLTWTFHLRKGIHYGLPLRRVEISAQDVIRALLREADPSASASSYSSYYSVIKGFDDVASGKAEGIAGLEAPDRYTLRVNLVHPQGDLGYLFTLPATAPIPPNPFAPSARLGVAEGHDRSYGEFLVSSGPYMVEGADALDFSRPPGDQSPQAGLAPGRSITLVRNPSWEPSTDPLRPAYVDRIELTLGGTLEHSSAAIDDGSLDLIFYQQTPPQAPAAQVAAYRRSQARGIVDIEDRDSIRYISMNLATPPFDDVHVRRAMNYVVNRSRAVDLFGGPTTARVAGHIGLDSLESNLLVTYDPYRTTGGRGDLRAAQREMAASRYDSNRDGICDAPSCQNIRALTIRDPSAIAIAKSAAKDARGIGIRLRVDPREDIFDLIGDPTNHIPLALDIAWIKDIPSASNFIAPLFKSSSLSRKGAPNNSLVGAAPQQLEAWGYRVRDVPNADNRIAQCEGTAGASALQCWSGVDQYLMTQVVPWVPLLSESHVQIVPSRIAHYSFDQFADLPALEQIAVRRKG